MKKINKGEQEQLSKLATKANGAVDELNDLVGELESKLNAVCDQFNDEHAAKIEKLIETYNESTEQYIKTLLAQEEKLTDYYDSRTEKWQESPRGVAYSDWLYDIKEAAPEVECVYEGDVPVNSIELKRLDLITLPLSEPQE